MDNKVYSKVFLWMFLGLAITFGIGYGLNIILTQNVNLMEMFFSKFGILLIIIIELVVAIALSAGLRKMNSTLAKLLYIVYCALTGITFSAIFMLFQMSSIIIIFLATSLIFGIFAVIGSKLNVSLNKFGTFLFMALLGIIIVEIINIFIGSTMLEMIISAVAILIFTLYIGYDIKKINALTESDIDEEKIAVYGAFHLYLDFINIFIRLLELFGKAKD